MGYDRHFLGYHHDAVPLASVTLAGPYSQASEVQSTGVGAGPVDARQDPHQGRLASTVVPNKGSDFATLDGEAQVTDCNEPRKALGDPVQFEDRSRFGINAWHENREMGRRPRLVHGVSWGPPQQVGQLALGTFL